MESAENQAQSISGNKIELSSEASLSRTETLKLLNDSIDQLEQTIKGIKDNSATIPPKESVNTLLSMTRKLADAVAPSFKTNSDSSEKVVEQKVITNSAEQIAPTVEKNSPIKLEPPEVTKIADKVEKKRNLTWVIVGVTAIAIAIVAIFWLWLPRQQFTSVSEPAASETLSNPPAEVNRQPVAKAPLTTSKTTPKNTTSERSTAESELLGSDPEDAEMETSAEISIPQVLDSPGRAKNLKMDTIEPQLDYTPEQTLVVSLENKVANLKQNYPTDLVSLVRVDLAQNSLLVEVTDNWYELSESRQNKLANEMLKTSRDFDFTKLELKDGEGALVARNPVIGDQIIILQNTKT